MPKAARKRSAGISKASALPTKLKQELLHEPIAGEEAIPTYSTEEDQTKKQSPASQSSTTVAKKAQQAKDGVISGNGSSGVALSRGQRKRLAKREKYLKRERMVMSSLKLKKQDEQAKRIDGLDALKEALLETICDKSSSTGETTRPAQLIRSNRGKRSIVHKEVEHMNLVLEHPAFKANPLAAIHEHLQNTTTQLAEEKPKSVPVKAKPKKKKTRFRATRMKNR